MYLVLCWGGWSPCGSSRTRGGIVWRCRNRCQSHVFAAGHQVDLSKATVIDTHPHAQTRCLLESVHIQHEQAPLNRAKETLPGLNATLLDWQRIRLTCLLYLLVLASPMHVNIFLLSPLHVILIPFGLYYIFDSLYFRLLRFTLNLTWPSPSVCTCVYTVSLVLYYYWWRQP